MSDQQEQTEWAVFGSAFWDEDTLVARADDGRWIYPGREFDPEPGQYYYLTLQPRKSKTTQRPYYIGYPRYGEIPAPPKAFQELIESVTTLDRENDKLIEENADLREENLYFREEVLVLREEINHLRLQRQAPEASNPPPILPNPKTISKMLANCSRGDLLGQHSVEKEKKVYRQLMQLIHPDKTRNLGAITLLILEELVKAVNNRYHPT